MHTKIKMKLKSLLLALLASTLLLNAAEETAKPEPLNVLVTTQTKGYRHASIPEAIKAFAQMANERNWKVTFTEDSSFFTPEVLDRMDVVVLLISTGDIFDEAQQHAIEQFVRNGGGLFGVHSGGTDTEYEWPWFRERIQAQFQSHPPVCEATLVIEDRDHPATRHYDSDRVLCEDEIYSFDKNPREHVHVLISVDESTYDTTINPWFKNVETHTMGDHPLAWYQKWEAGRVIQTALGHTDEQYQDPSFRAQLAGALEWSAGRD